MTGSGEGEKIPLFSDDELDAMVVESESVRPVPGAKDPITEVREFHGWTLDKLEVLDLYFKLYRRVAGGGTYIDAFAGTGEGTTETNGKSALHDGSSLIAAKSDAFSSLHLIENNQTNFRALGSAVQKLSDRQKSKIHLYNGDCNLIIPDLLSSEQLDNSRPCFVLMDQDSTQLEWSTIEILASWKNYEPPATLKGRPKTCKVELWILFNSHQAVNRLWPDDRFKHPETLSAETLDRIFGGSDYWRDLWDGNRPTSALVQRYADRLRGLGYQYVIPQLIRDPMTRRPQYHMFHATDHPSAISLMRWTKKKISGYENQQFPGMETSS